MGDPREALRAEAIVLAKEIKIKWTCMQYQTIIGSPRPIPPLDYFTGHLEAFARAAVCAELESVEHFAATFPEMRDVPLSKDVMCQEISRRLAEWRKP